MLYPTEYGVLYGMLYPTEYGVRIGDAEITTSLPPAEARKVGGRVSELVLRNPRGAGAGENETRAGVRSTPYMGIFGMDGRGKKPPALHFFSGSYP